MASTINLCNLFSITLALLCAFSFTTEAKPAHLRKKHTNVNNIPLAQTQTDIDGENDFEAEESADNDAEEVDNESEIDADVESVNDVDTDTDIDAVVAADAVAPNPIGRNGWMGSGLRKAQGQNDHGYLEGESKASHVGIGFGVVILVIAVVVVSGLAIKRPGSNNEPADLDLE